MNRLLRLALLLGGCAGAPHPQEAGSPLDPLSNEWSWVEQVGAVLTPVRRCLLAHQEGRAAVVGIRTLATGELAIMTSSRQATVACIYAGHEVVDRRPVAVSEQLLRRLPHVTVAGTPRLEGRDCWEERQITWAGKVVGWALLPACSERLQ